MSELEQLTQRVHVLENLLHNLTFNGEYRFFRNVKFAPGATLGLTGNVAIGNSASKVGFYGVTEVAQQAAITAPSGGTTVDSAARVAINTIISDLKTIGITL